MRRAQDRPRGHAGDFETVEYLLAGRNGADPGSGGWYLDEHLLHAPIAQQQRNRTAHRARPISAALAGRPPGGHPVRILLIASGGAADLRTVDPGLLETGDVVVPNDGRGRPRPRAGHAAGATPAA
ncbi:hypothetical protein ACIQUQ_27605 [Streptomyces sp. NPDC101118]|uniref:hypothetical protein n=1 Tax=Streptomyces sp. NPDC101118 TaxID=3366109 RepID=UPI0037FD0E2B